MYLWLREHYLSQTAFGYKKRTRYQDFYFINVFTLKRIVIYFKIYRVCLILKALAATCWLSMTKEFQQIFAKINFKGKSDSESVGSSVMSDSLRPHGRKEPSLPGSPVHGFLQVRILEWVAISFFRGSSQPRDWTQVSHIAGRFFTIWATWEAKSDRTFSSSPEFICYAL